jgi:hypothetical protein
MHSVRLHTACFYASVDRSRSFALDVNSPREISRSYSFNCILIFNLSMINEQTGSSTVSTSRATVSTWVSSCIDYYHMAEPFELDAINVTVSLPGSSNRDLARVLVFKLIYIVEILKCIIRHPVLQSLLAINNKVFLSSRARACRCHILKP